MDPGRGMMHAARWAVVALFLTLQVGGAEGAGKSATDLMGEALKLRASGRLAAAVTVLEEAVAATSSASQRTLARFMLGDCLLEDGKAAAARDVYKTLLTADLTDDEQAEARYRLAQCHDRLGETEEVGRLCRQITRQHAGSPFAQLARLLQKAAGAKAPPAATYVSAEEAARTPPATRPRPAAPAAPVREPAPADAGGPLPDELPAGEEPPAEPEEPVEEPLAEEGPAVVAAPAPPPAPSSAAGRPAAKPAPAAVPAAVPAPAAAGVRRPAVEPAAPAPAPAPASRPGAARVTRPAPTVPAGAPADLLRFPPPSQEEREALAGEILSAQESLQRSPDAPDNDSLLFRMASATARFGEHLEACKAYDRLLTQYPTSQFAEQAYYEAIRLRAFLKVYRPVVEWGEAFLATFPRSARAAAVRRLVDFARRALAAPAAAAAGSPAPAAKPSPGSRKKVEDDPRYQEAKRRMAAERYAMALRDFEALSRIYPDQPVIWWDLALVQVQQERYGEAETSLNRLLALNPENKDGRSLLGYVHYQKKDFQKAADVYEKTDESASGEGLKFFDPQNAAKRMQKTRPSSAAPAVKKTHPQEGELP